MSSLTNPEKLNEIPELKKNDGGQDAARNKGKPLWRKLLLVVELILSIYFIYKGYMAFNASNGAEGMGYIVLGSISLVLSLVDPSKWVEAIVISKVKRKS